jgi:hypothetical protein
MKLSTLLERLHNDRFTDDPNDYKHESASGHGYIRGWNACSRNAEIVRRWAQEQGIEWGSRSSSG